MARISKAVGTLGPSRHIVVEYLAPHLEEVAFWPVSRLAQAVSVSESAVVRAARDLGFSGYPALQQCLQEIVKERLFRGAHQQVAEQRAEPAEDLYNRVRAGAVRNLEHAYRSNSPQTVQQAAAMALNARRIGVVGSRVAYPVVRLLAFYLQKLLGNATAWDIGDDTLVDALRVLQPGDLVIAIGFRNYSARTVRAVKLARSLGADVIALTDSPTSPITAMANLTMLSETENTAIIRSLVGPVALAEQFLAAIVQQGSDRVTMALDELSKTTEQFNQ